MSDKKRCDRKEMQPADRSQRSRWKLEAYPMEMKHTYEGDQLEVRFTDGSSLIVGPMVRNEPTVQYSTNGHRGSWGHYG